MATDYTAEIAYLEKLVNASVSATNTDGASTTWDLDHAKKRLAELRLLEASTMARPTVFRIKMGGAW
tara:strand:+ start:74 stop:274 length:201 start_codon:yes stop_codon:yes gene_type:complete